jgi:hypothetical protein
VALPPACALHAEREAELRLKELNIVGFAIFLYGAAASPTPS